MARRRKSIEGWDWWKTPPKKNPAPPVALDLIDHADLSPFSTHELWHAH